MSLLACMCNQPQRLAEALAPLRAAIVAPGPIARWGLGYVHGGEVLLSRTPRSAASEGDAPLDFFPAIEPIRSDCIIGQATALSTGSDDHHALPTEATQPFRFRRWMLAQDGRSTVDAADWQKLVERIPDFLRRSMRGRTSAELTLFLLMAALHDQGIVDDPNLPSSIARQALAETLSRFGVGTVAASNTRALWVARPLAETGAPIYIRRLQVLDDRGNRDDSFRGVLITSGLPVGDGAEEVPAGSMLSVSRDLRVDISPLA